MNLKKKVVAFYSKIKELEMFGNWQKEVHRFHLKLPGNSYLTLSEIQRAIDDQWEVRNITLSLEKLRGDLMQIQKKIVSALMEIDFPEEKRVMLEDAQHGSITFWYKGNNLFIENKSGNISQITE